MASPPPLPTLMLGFARVICSDPSRFTHAHACELAQQIMSAISREIRSAIDEIVTRIDRPIT